MESRTEIALITFAEFRDWLVDLVWKIFHGSQSKSRTKKNVHAVFTWYLIVNVLRLAVVKCPINGRTVTFLLGIFYSSQTAQWFLCLVSFACLVDIINELAIAVHWICVQQAPFILFGCQRVLSTYGFFLLDVCMLTNSECPTQIDFPFKQFSSVFFPSSEQALNVTSNNVN